jgi:hypothetical protein
MTTAPQRNPMIDSCWCRSPGPGKVSSSPEARCDPSLYPPARARARAHARLQICMRHSPRAGHAGQQARHHSARIRTDLGVRMLQNRSSHFPYARRQAGCRPTFLRTPPPSSFILLAPPSLFRPLLHRAPPSFPCPLVSPRGPGHGRGRYPAAGPRQAAALITRDRTH